jgi:hypothetical protein
MINWKELEKFIAPGKVLTLVIMVDGKEVGALSFNVDTLAYKEILEVVKPAEAIVIPDKKPEPVKPVTTETKKPGKATHKPAKPESVIEEPNEELDNDEEDPDIDEETGEVIEPAAEVKSEPVSEAKVEPDVPLTREQIMSGTAPEASPEVKPHKITAQDINEGKAKVTDLIAQEKKELADPKPEVKKELTLGGEEW